MHTAIRGKGHPMRKFLIAFCMALPLLAAPTAVTHAGGIQPYCVHSGNQCLIEYSAQVTDQKTGVTETVQWSVDEYSGDIESADGSLSVTSCYSAESPVPPTQNPITFAYHYLATVGGPYRYISLTVNSSGGSSGQSGYYGPTC